MGWLAESFWFSSSFPTAGRILGWVPKTFRCVFSPNSVSTLWGSYGRQKEWCPSRCPSATVAFDCAGSRRVPFVMTVCGRSSVTGFWVVLPGVRGLFGAGSTREFTWQAQGIGHFVKIVAGAVFCGRASFEGLRFTWHAQGIRSMDAMFSGRRVRFLTRATFLEIELEDQFAWPVRHFVWPGVMISWQVQYFWNMFPFSWKFCRNVWILSFRGSLAENAHFGSLQLQFSKKSRAKRSFWSSGSWKSRINLKRSFWTSRSLLFEEVSHKTLVWKSGSSVFEEVSHKMLVLEVRVFSFRGRLAEFVRLHDPDASGPKGS